MMRFSLILIAICFLLSCKQQPKVLVIQPLGNFPVAQAEKVLEEVGHLYPYEEEHSFSGLGIL